MEFRVRLQLAEVFGPVNRWFCSQAFGREIREPEMLLIYYIRSGGAADFALRYEQAMGKDNRWYCSEFYGRDIRDPGILWDYYVKHCAGRRAENDPRYQPQLSIAS
jgi:hypothetical protein